METTVSTTKSSKRWGTVPFEKSVATYPLLSQEYSLENNRPADQVYAGTGKKLWWRCKRCGHEWRAVGYSRVSGGGCPACAGRIPTAKNNLAVTHPKLAKEFSLEKNFPLTPDKVIAGTGKKLWWKCSKCNHEWQATGNKRVRGSSCPACANQIVTPTNNLAFLYPLLALEYSSRNDLPASQVIPTTGKILIWHCQECGKEWRTSGAHRVGDGTGCPVCVRKATIEKRKGKMVHQKSSFSQSHPSLVREYSTELNKLPPDEYLPLNDDIIWWQCQCGYQWRARMSARLDDDIGCPDCDRKSRGQKITLNCFKTI